MAIHLTYGGSTAARTIGCPAWASRAKTVPTPASSHYADEGTLLHEVMEAAFEKDVHPAELLNVVSYNDLVFTDDDDQLDVATVAWEATNEVLDHYGVDEMLLEPMVRISEDQGGSIDLLGVGLDHLVVLDYKFGRGPVAVENNIQLKFYALAAYHDDHTRELFNGVENVALVIIQPRVYGNKPQVFELSVQEIIDFKKDWDEAVELSRLPNPPAAAGSHCSFCPYMPWCKEQARSIDAAMRLDPKDSATLSDAYSRIADIKTWISAVERATYDCLDTGINVPGYKLVAKRAQRKWADPEQAEAFFKKCRRVKHHEYHDYKLISPARAEKLCKAKKVSFFELDEVVIKESSGYTVAPMSDKREAVSVSDGRDILIKALDAQKTSS